MRFIIIATCLVITQSVVAQKTTVPTIDINKLMKMTPAEREKYAEQMKKQYSEQAVQIAETANFTIDETILPGIEIKPPVKDIQRLALIPIRVPTQTELITQVKASRERLQTTAPPVITQEVQKFTATHAVEEIHEAALASFYSSDPVKSLMLMMQAVEKRADSSILWNNLAAMFNMSGLEHKAIPMLRYCLEKVPQSSIVLNNLGQAYMGLGELMKAEDYFHQCLDVDEFNPDANHSMGMLKMYKKDFDAAMSYFNREMEVAMRRSSIAYAAKMGKPVDLNGLRKKKNAQDGRVQRNFFEEISLGKFMIPTFPKTAKEAKSREGEFAAFTQSVGAELLFWNSIIIPQSVVEQEGKLPPGLYSNLVEALLTDLHKEFTPKYLGNFTDADAAVLLEIQQRNGTDLAKVKCPELPAGSTVEEQVANEAKCCEERRRPLHDRLIAEYGGYMRPKIDVAQQRWKSYLNQLIAIVQLDPCSANQLLVYKQVSNYFYFLNWSMLFAVGGSTEPSGCIPNFTVAQADSVITANREWRLACPAWLSLELDLTAVKLKADCSKFGIEGGKVLMAGYERDFKTGTSTIMAGAGLSAKFFANIGKASVKQFVYISFDNNLNFSDFGIRGKAEVGIGDNPIKIGKGKAGGTIAGIEGGYTWGINSGFNSSVKGKGAIADFVKIESNKL